MPLTNAGRDLIAAAIVGATYTPYNNANAYIGVGDGTTAFAKTQTDLQGANKLRRPMMAGYPQLSGNIITWRASFGPNDANFAWNEFGVFNASTGGTMLLRLVQSKGTKQSGDTWEAELRATVDNP
jgi:hypothetical protein